MAESSDSPTPSKSTAPTSDTNQVNETPLPTKKATFGEKPINVQCVYCKSQTETKVEFRSGTMCWIISLILLFSGLWLGCFLIPFCIKGLKDCIHMCSECGYELGRFQRLQTLNNRNDKL